MTFQQIMQDFGLFIEVLSVQRKMTSVHMHEAYEIYYLIHGDRDYFIEDSFFHVNEGDFILIPKGKLHRTGGKTCTRLVISFSEEYLLRYCTKHGANFLLKAFEQYHVHPEGAAAQRVLSLFDEMKKLYAERSDRLFVLLSELLDILAQAKPVEEERSKATERIREIVEYVNKNHATIVGIQEIADTFYLSKAYLCRIFKRTVGIPFSDYLNKTKLYHATRLLVTTNKSISEIATVCGFHSSAYFCNVFKKEYGVNPIMYKRDHGER